MNLTSAHKPLGIAVVPRGWSSLCVADLGVVVTGGTPSTQIKTFWNGEYPWVTPTDITERRDMYTSERLLSRAGIQAIRVLPADTLLVTCIASIGKNAILKSVGACNQQINALVPSKTNSAEFLYYLFEANKSSLLASAATTATSLISKTTFERLVVAVPPLHEQRTIAAALSDVDALLGSLDRLIAKKRDLKQGAMQQFLTGRTRLPGFTVLAGSRFSAAGDIPADWKVACIREVASIKTGKRNTQDRVIDGAYPFFVRSQTVERINTYSFDGEAVLTAGDGVGTGKVFHYIRGRFDFHQRVYRISEFAPCVDGLYFFLYFSTHFYDRIMSMTAKSSVDSVRLDMIADMALPLPTLAEQQAIAAVLSDMDAEIAALEQRRDKTRLLKQAMMQELLTGRTRLV